MSDFASQPSTAFAGVHQIARGPLSEVALAVKAAAPAADPILVFDDATGDVVDLDLRGDAAEVVARLAGRGPKAAAAAPAQGRGRPRLGVVAREVTLLPRHWEWLAAQGGGASNVLRRLVDEARRADGGKSQARTAQAAAYRFMSAMAGDLPGFEEASRALFAGDADGFAERTAAWPPDVRDHVRALAFGDRTATAS
jgi:hypothetical protein